MTYLKRQNKTTHAADKQTNISTKKEQQEESPSSPYDYPEAKAQSETNGKTIKST